MNEPGVRELMEPPSTLEGKYFTVPAGELYRLRAAEIIAKEFALLNPVTGLPNIRAVDRFVDRKQREFRRSGKYEDVTIVDMDLRGFKKINDEFSDTTGDAVLAEVGITLAELMRPEEFLANPRGDQFYVIAVGVKPEESEAMVNRLTGAVHELVLEDTDKLGVTREIRPELKARTMTVPGDSDFKEIFGRIGKSFYEKSREPPSEK